MESLQNLMDQGQRTLDALCALGVEQARVSLSNRREYQLTTKDGQTETLKEHQAMSLSLDLFVQGRYGSFSSSDLRPEAVADFAARAVELVKLTDPDPHRGLPEPEQCAPLPEADLQLFDQALAAGKKEDSIALCQRITEAARGVDPEIFNVQANYREVHGRSVQLSSAGFAGQRESTQVSVGGSAHVPDGETKKQSGWDHRSWRHWQDADEPESVGQLVAERALAMRGAAPIATGEYPVVIVNYWGDFLGYKLLQVLRGSSVYRKMSCLGDKLGQPIASQLLTLHDDPLVPRGLQSQRYDDEGMVARRMPLIEGGVLKNFYYPTYWARKQGVAPTTGNPSNLVYELGERDGLEMVKDLERGIFVTGFIGGNMNGTTGDFSAGIKGFLIEKGQLARPVSELNLAGNLLDMLQKLEEVGNDPYPFMSIMSPATRFAPLMVAGAG